MPIDEEVAVPAVVVEGAVDEPVVEPTPPEAPAGPLYVSPKENLQVTQEFPHSKPAKDPTAIDWMGLNESLNLLGGNIRDLNELITNYPNIDSNSDPKSSHWVDIMRVAQSNLMRGDSFAASTERAGSDWGQAVDYEGQKLAPSRPRFNDGGTVLTGERAILRVSAMIGMGSIVQVPLWHTGIWISFKAPPESAILELERRIANEKTTLGRHTHGLVFSNTSVYMIMELIDFALNYVFDTNAKELTADHLKSVIKVTDIPMLLWGAALAIYPNGYPYAQSCTKPDGTCNHVIHEILDLAKLAWTDRSALTDWQKKRMSQRKTRMTADDLVRYASEHTHGGERVVELTDEVSFRLRVPTLSDYETSGYAWIDNIVTMMEEAFKTPLRGEERNNYITSQGRLTTMRQYVHWVDEVIVPDAEISKDVETIDGLLSLFSSSDQLRDSFLAHVGKYIDDATIAIIALPKHNCPACNHPQEKEEKDGIVNKHPFLIPLDTAHLFFTLLNQRISKVLTKSSL